MKFIETVLPWIALLAGIFCLAACIRWEEDRKWFWGLFLGNITVFMMACMLPKGPALLNHRKIIPMVTLERIGNQLMRGTNTPVIAYIPVQKSTRGGSWVWWKSWAILLPFTLLCACFAFEEKIGEILKKREENKKAHAEVKTEAKTDTKEKSTKTENTSAHFWQMDFWDIVSMAIEMVRLVRGRK